MRGPYELQAVGLGKPWMTIGLPHMGSMEARLVLDRSDTICGIPPSSIAGNTINEKRASLHGATVQDLKPLVDKGEWICHHDVAALVVIPTGCIVVYVSYARLCLGGLCVPASKTLLASRPA